MLIEFTATNYRSFRETLTFSMSPAPKQKGLDYSIMSEKAGRRAYKALSSAIIYGPNAAGKTNIIGAMDTMRAIVMRGHINNAEVMDSPNVASNRLEMIPFSGLTSSEPVKFGIKFVENQLYIEYDLEIDIGMFWEHDYDRAILLEKLCVNGKNVFIRDKQTLQFGSILDIRRYLNSGADKNWDSIYEIAKSSLSKKELFLTNGFKSIVSKALALVITDWFTSKFMVIYRANAMQLIQKYINPQEDEVYVNKTLSEVAKAFGITSSALGFKHSKEGNDARLCSIIERGDEQITIPAENFESYGTVRFIYEFPLIIAALLTGATLVADEFDASIHPVALMSIISIFHNDEINKKHAQLIFNTHNPIFLSPSFYRRDEIKFVARDEESHESVHYSLADFKTAGKGGVRKSDDYMKNYFASQYGAIKDIDFADLFEELITDKEDYSDE